MIPSMAAQRNRRVSQLRMVGVYQICKYLAFIGFEGVANTEAIHTA
jgi:hypothetical protein